MISSCKPIIRLTSSEISSSTELAISTAEVATASTMKRQSLQDLRAQWRLQRQTSNSVSVAEARMQQQLAANLQSPLPAKVQQQTSLVTSQFNLQNAPGAGPGNIQSTLLHQQQQQQRG